jgi:hypothetical protein
MICRLDNGLLLSFGQLKVHNEAFRYTHFVSEAIHENSGGSYGASAETGVRGRESGDGGGPRC